MKRATGEGGIGYIMQHLEEVSSEDPRLDDILKTWLETGRPYPDETRLYALEATILGAVSEAQMLLRLYLQQLSQELLQMREKMQHLIELKDQLTALKSERGMLVAEANDLVDLNSHTSIAISIALISLQCDEIEAQLNEDPSVLRSQMDDKIAELRHAESQLHDPEKLASGALLNLSGDVNPALVSRVAAKFLEKRGSYYITDVHDALLSGHLDKRRCEQNELYTSNEGRLKLQNGMPLAEHEVRHPVDGSVLIDLNSMEDARLFRDIAIAAALSVCGEDELPDNMKAYIDKQPTDYLARIQEMYAIFLSDSSCIGLPKGQLELLKNMLPEIIEPVISHAGSMSPR